MGFLEKILPLKEREVELLREKRRELEDLAERRKEVRSLRKALTGCRTKIIAEVKKASPSAGKIREVDPVTQAKTYQEAGAVAISVLTDGNYFGGSVEDLKRVSEAVDIPVLRKDFIIDELQILEAKAYGADAVLLIVRALSPERLKDLIAYAYDLGLEPLVEVFSLQEAKLALRSGARVIGINNRDLETLKVDVFLTKELAPKIKELGAQFVVAESGIETREQIEELLNCQVDAFLIGTSLMKSDDPARKLKELLGFVCS